MPMKSPPHIGRVIWNGVLDPLDLSVTKAAEVLGVRRATLSDLVNGKAALTAEMALRIHKAFGPDVDHLLRMQAAYDAAQIRSARENLEQVWAPIATSLYSQAGADSGAAAGAGAPHTGEHGAPGAHDDVVDAEFRASDEH